MLDSPVVLLIFNRPTQTQRILGGNGPSQAEATVRHRRWSSLT